MSLDSLPSIHIPRWSHPLLCTQSRQEGPMMNGDSPGHQGPCEDRDMKYTNRPLGVTDLKGPWVPHGEGPLPTAGGVVIGVCPL